MGLINDILGLELELRPFGTILIQVTDEGENSHKMECKIFLCINGICNLE